MAKYLNTKVAEAGITKLIQLQGRDCKPTQFVREFIMNSIEAIQRTKKVGKILVDVNWDLFLEHDIYKVSFLDTGDGMTLDQMLQHLNHLSSSGSEENVFENYGMGAKISALTRNHEGIMYDSWKNGEGHRIIIRFDEQDQIYGVSPSEDEYGKVHWGIRLSEDDKPNEIHEHGTRVTLFGHKLNEDTMLPPSSAKGGRDNWLHYYINSRFFDIPENIEIRVRTAYYKDKENTRHNYLSILKGQRNTLNKNSVASGIVVIPNANIHWWILNPDAQGHGRENLSGHTACINQSEIFDVTDGRSNRAQHFGIILGKEDIVLYVEPDDPNILQDTTRTRLLKEDGSEMPWEYWQDEFKKVLPKEIEEFIKEKLAATRHDGHDESIRQRLSKMKDFYRLSRYKPIADGAIDIDPDSEINAKVGTGVKLTNTNGGNRNSDGGEAAGAITELLRSRTKQVGEKAKQVNPDNYPVVSWITRSNGTRDKTELMDRAAEYLERENFLKINEDFQGFHDVFSHYNNLYKDLPNGKEIIWTSIKEIFEQQLVESVIGAQQLRNRPDWTPEDFENALSQEALTTAVMTRYFIIDYLDRTLKKKIGSSISLTKNAGLSVHL